LRRKVPFMNRPRSRANTAQTKEAPSLGNETPSVERQVAKVMAAAM
jgi:hypothetical protein